MIRLSLFVFLLSTLQFYTLDVSAETLTWGGTTNDRWDEPSNWNPKRVPSRQDWVVIPKTKVQPVVNTEVSFQGFAKSKNGGGTLTISKGNNIRLLSKRDTIRSSVEIKGKPMNCEYNCGVWTSGDLEIKSDAKLQLGTGVTLYLKDDSTILLGDGKTAGHLRASNFGATASEWPIIISDGEDGKAWHKGITLRGTPQKKSSVELDGLHVRHCKYGDFILDFQNFYTIGKMENFHLHFLSENKPDKAVRFKNCKNSELQARWDYMMFDFKTAEKNDINVQFNCAKKFGFTLNAHGSGAFKKFSRDPNNALKWIEGHHRHHGHEMHKGHKDHHNHHKKKDHHGHH